MRSTLNRIATFAAASAIALAAVSSASAASHHHRRHAAPIAQDEMIGRNVQLSPQGGTMGVPAAEWNGPYGCVTDEGYGRYGSCEAGGGGQ